MLNVVTVVTNQWNSYHRIDVWWWQYIYYIRLDPLSADWTDACALLPKFIEPGRDHRALYARHCSVGILPARWGNVGFLLAPSPPRYCQRGVRHKLLFQTSALSYRKKATCKWGHRLTYVTCMLIVLSRCHGIYWTYSKEWKSQQSTLVKVSCETLVEGSFRFVGGSCTWLEMKEGKYSCRKTGVSESSTNQEHSQE